jgi:hypothetical protein
VLEGHGKGWDRFISELQIAVNFFQPCLAKNLGVKKRRKFSKVLFATISPTEEPFIASSEPLARVPMWLAVNNSQPSVAPANFPAKSTQFPAQACGPPPHAKRATQRISVPANLNILDTSVGPFGIFDRVNLRMSLEALQLEIGRCLSNLNAGMCSCGSGLLGSGLESGGPISKDSKFWVSKGKAKRAAFGAKKSKSNSFGVVFCFSRWVGSRVKETQVLRPPPASSVGHSSSRWGSYPPPSHFQRVESSSGAAPIAGGSLQCPECTGWSCYLMLRSCS